MNRYNRVDNTAPVNDVAEGKKPEVKYSMFDLSCKEVGQAMPYALIPIDVIRTFPNSDIDLNYDVQVTFRNPTVRKLLNGFRVYLHAYYNKNSDLWEGWNNFITKGRSGNENLQIPYLKTRYDYQPNKNMTYFTPMSLMDYLGYPPEAYYQLDKNTGITGAIIESDTMTGLANYANIKISALPAMMYQRLWRDKYAPSNLLSSNKNIYPDNEDHFILSYNATNVGIVDYGNETGSSISFPDRYSDNRVTGNNNLHLNIEMLRFRQFNGDRFTTASPFKDMLRGTAPTLDYEILSQNLKVNIPSDELKVKVKGFSNPNDGVLYAPEQTPTSILNQGLFIGMNDINGVGVTYTDDIIVNTKAQEIAVTGNDISLKVSLNDLRKLEVFTIFAERMARNDGSYNSMIKSQFGYNPNSLDKEAKYIGGSFQDITQNTIYQTSASGTDSQSGTSYLGKQVGQGVSASYNKLGSFHSNDYGMIMVIMSIVPETIYTQGLNKADTAINFEEQYFPIFENLAPTPILNKELYVSGTEATDNDLFGYAERFSEYKARENKVKGFSQLSNTQDAYDSALVMSRKFNTTPNLNANFVTGIPNNVSLDAFTASEEPPFDYVVLKDVRAKYPMSYITIPEGLGTGA